MLYNSVTNEDDIVGSFRWSTRTLPVQYIQVQSYNYYTTLCSIVVLTELLNSFTRFLAFIDGHHQNYPEARCCKKGLCIHRVWEREGEESEREREDIFTESGTCASNIRLPYNPVRSQTMLNLGYIVVRVPSFVVTYCNS